jgi:hypothetical protein
MHCGIGGKMVARSATYRRNFQNCLKLILLRCENATPDGRGVRFAQAYLAHGRMGAF